MYSAAVTRFFAVFVLATAPSIAFPVGAPFGSPSQAIFSPSGGSVLYRQGANGANGAPVASPLTHQFGQAGVPPGQIVPAGGQQGQKGRCNVYYYCCIFYCWSKWTPCGCYLICADSENGGGEMIPADSADAAGLTTADDLFVPPSGTVSAELAPPATPPTVHGQAPTHDNGDRDRSDVPPINNNNNDDDHHDDSGEYEDGGVNEEAPPMMGGNADRKVTSDDEPIQVLVTDRTPEIDFNPPYQPQPQIHPLPPAEPQIHPEPLAEPHHNDEEEADPNDPPPQPDDQLEVPVEDGDDGEYDHRPPLPEDEEFEEGVGFDEQQLTDDDDGTLIAFGQEAQGRKPLLVHYPQSGVVFEARSGDRLPRRAGNKDKEEKKKNDKKEWKQKNKVANKEERRKNREERRKNKEQRRKERKANKNHQQQNVDNKFLW